MTSVHFWMGEGVLVFIPYTDGAAALIPVTMWLSDLPMVRQKSEMVQGTKPRPLESWASAITTEQYFPSNTKVI